MILTYKNKPEIVWLGGYLRNFCQNFGKKRNFGQNLDFIEFRPKFRVEREFRPNRNRNQKSSFRFRSSRNRNTNLNFGFGFLLSKICFLCSLGGEGLNFSKFLKYKLISDTLLKMKIKHLICPLSM